MLHAEREVGRARRGAVDETRAPGSTVAPTSSLTVMKWNDVVADDSKYKPSIESIRPFVKYGSSSSDERRAVRCRPSSPPSQSARPAGRLVHRLHQRVGTRATRAGSRSPCSCTAPNPGSRIAGCRCARSTRGAVRTCRDNATSTASTHRRDRAATRRASRSGVELGSGGSQPGGPRRSDARRASQPLRGARRDRRRGGRRAATSAQALARTSSRSPSRIQRNAHVDAVRERGAGSRPRPSRR